MARIPEVSDSPDEPFTREIFKAQIEKYGFVFNTSKIYAHRPTIMHGLNLLQQGVDKSGLLGADLKALVNVRVATINGCPF